MKTCGAPVGNCADLARAVNNKENNDNRAAAGSSNCFLNARGNSTRRHSVLTGDDGRDGGQNAKAEFEERDSRRRRRTAGPNHEYRQNGDVFVHTNKRRRPSWTHARLLPRPYV